MNTEVKDLGALGGIESIQRELSKMKTYLVNTQSTLTSLAVLLGVDPIALANTIRDDEKLREFERAVVTQWQEIDKEKTVDNSGETVESK